MAYSLHDFRVGNRKFIFYFCSFLAFSNGRVVSSNGRLLVQNVCSIFGPALMSMVIDSLPPENRGAGFSFQSVITTLVLLPAPLIAQYLVVTFNFDLGMRIAYILVAVAYFAIAILRLKLKETLPATEKSQRPSLSAHYGTILNQLKKAFMFGRRFPNQPLTFS